MEQPDRHPTGDEPRGVTDPAWEVFVRTEETAPLRHVGSVSAPSADVAHDEAAALFPAATDVWLCPASAVRRYATRSLTRRAEDPAPVSADGDGGDP